MNIEVIIPSGSIDSAKQTIDRLSLKFKERSTLSTHPECSSLISKLKFPVFKINNNDEYYVLIKDLSTSWGFPSSYQLISKILKQTGMSSDELVQTTSQELNLLLLKEDLISSKEAKQRLFYSRISLLYELVENKDVFHISESDIRLCGSDKIGKESGDEDAGKSEEPRINAEVKEFIKKSLHKHQDDGITISQVFPHYGLIKSNVEMSHSFFNSLNNFAKLNFYKSSPNAYRFLPNNKLTYAEREMIYKENDFSELSIDFNKDKVSSDKEIRKISNKRKSSNSFDPNSVDLTESVIPGQGYIQEFNINHLCKVPSYYITSNNQHFLAAESKFNLKLVNENSNSSFLFSESLKAPQNIQKLQFSNEAEGNNFHKYYYTKSYRGPGSGNYKDASVMNRINRIQTTLEPIKNSHKVSKQLAKPPQLRYNQNLKGLVHEKFNKRVVERLLSNQRKYTEDYVNLEMLHSNAQFNLLVNSYREMSEETWGSFYEYKMTDFEQLGATQRENSERKSREAYIRDYEEWQRSENKRQEKLRNRSEKIKERSDRAQLRKLEKQREFEEKQRRRQLEASFNDPFGDGSDDFLKELEEENAVEDENSELSEEEADLHVPRPPPVPIETPQLDIQSKFTQPSFHPEIVKSLPIDLRAHNDQLIPSIKKVVRYIATYPDSNNLEVLNRLEIIKFPNSNSMGWENLRRYRD